MDCSSTCLEIGHLLIAFDDASEDMEVNIGPRRSYRNSFLNDQKATAIGGSHAYHFRFRKRADSGTWSTRGPHPDLGEVTFDPQGGQDVCCRGTCAWGAWGDARVASWAGSWARGVTRVIRGVVLHGETRDLNLARTRVNHGLR